MALIPPSVTIQEVADLARVSPKTVSRVINNEPRVRSDTRARILEAIDKLSHEVAEARADGHPFAISDIPFPATRAYVQKVLQAQRDYRRTYPKLLGYS